VNPALQRWIIKGIRSVDVLGLRIDDVTYDESLLLVEQFVASGLPHAIVTPNPEFAMRARSDPSFRAVLARSALAVPDGIGLIIAAGWLGRPIREHVRGTDLVHRLAARSVERGWRWFLLGAADGVAAEAADALRRRYPGLQVVGVAAGSPRAEDDPWVHRQIQLAGRIDIILVAYGAPAQEYWMDRNLGPLQIPVGIGVGGVLDYLAGRVPRAPSWVQRLELEFLYRLLTQPWRWRRQLALPHFALLAAREALEQRLLGQSAWPYNERLLGD
jgi:N-acetylglucosaminyldiphosphoundecaprenol N-acetyl-beta-D-mannosaminyltransferase